MLKLQPLRKPLVDTALALPSDSSRDYAVDEDDEDELDDDVDVDELELSDAVAYGDAA